MVERAISKTEPVTIAIDWGKPGADKTMMFEARWHGNGKIEVISLGEVIEGELAPSPKDQPQ